MFQIMETRNGKYREELCVLETPNFDFAYESLIILNRRGEALAEMFPNRPVDRYSMRVRGDDEPVSELQAWHDRLTGSNHRFCE